MAVLAADGHGPLLSGACETSEATQQLVDSEVRRIIETAYAEVTSLLTEHRHQLDSLAHALLRAETLDVIAPTRRPWSPCAQPIHVTAGVGDVVMKVIVSWRPRQEG